MVILEALNATYGDCLLLRYPGPDKKEKLWLIDGGPKGATINGTLFSVWKDVLLPRLAQLSKKPPVTIHLGMVSHIDDDHINGMQRVTELLVRSGPGTVKPVEFERFWFNSFLDLVGPAKPGAAPSAMPMAVAQNAVGEIDHSQVPPEMADYLHTSEAVVQSVGQGNKLAQDIGSLQLTGNQPVGGLISAKPGQGSFNILGAEVTVLGPRADRLQDLRQEWADAVAEQEAEKRKAKLQELFLPTSKLDRSVPNLSSIVVLVVVGGQRLLLTGDALGDDIVDSWIELRLEAKPVSVDVLKMPHHGSIRNCSEKFLSHFHAAHYIFSADGHYDNPDGATVEAVVKLHHARDITLHFTNQDIRWSAPYTTETSLKAVATLDDLIEQLRVDYPGSWKTNCRKPAELGVTIAL